MAGNFKDSKLSMNKKKKKLYQMSNTACEEEDFPFPPEYDPMERITVKNKTNKSRRQKHNDRL